MATSIIKQPSFHGMFMHTYETLSHAVSANSSKTITKNITNSGWYPVGVAGWRVNGTMSSWMRVSTFSLSNYAHGSATINMTLYNSGSSASSGDVEVAVLWQKIA